MTELQLKALLRGKKLPCSDEQITAILESRGFFRDGAGRICFRRTEPDHTSRSDRHDAAVGLNLTQLCVLLGVGPGDVQRHMRGLASSQPEIRWQRLWQELDLGKLPRISTGTLASLRESIDRERARQFKDEAKTRNQRIVETSGPTKRRPVTKDKGKSQTASTPSGQADPSAKVEANRRVLDVYLEKRRTRIAARSSESLAPDRTAPAADHASPAIQRQSSSAFSWVRTANGCLWLRIAPAETEGERRLESSLQSLKKGLVILNATVRVGRQEREVDAIIVHPHAVITVEQKDTRHRGEIVVPLNGPATVGGNAVDESFRTQARKAAQLLASLLQKTEPRIALGFVTPVLCFHGRDIHVRDDEPTEVRIATTETVAVLARDIGEDQPPLKAPEVERLLAVLGLPSLNEQALRELGFS
ncbi:hypothetical protein GL325_06395 [Aeromicrobium sp. 636]|uniref:NERD domain-containing protein n=1 Tax=Aeromicrobium senzhongii TaxID=2663859 RepID=A0A8I0EV65_9ACTN|nr:MULTISPECIES: nuclease-related domain-containing protein [Aeromicrobium]MBC9225942.1 NERD domain-containing protein [Aeromicrobium senzhongii]MCQ3998049.1 hypothetical protein [Aeromicrobium sp. 636]